MSPTTILERIRGLFASDTGGHLDSISDALLEGTLQEPARPMSDQELARAIREFRSVPVSDRTIARLSRRLPEASKRDV
ncbi:hypothetical protein [Bradyrhizobium liaoningense]